MSDTKRWSEGRCQNRSSGTPFVGPVTAGGGGTQPRIQCLVTVRICQGRCPPGTSWHPPCRGTARFVDPPARARLFHRRYRAICSLCPSIPLLTTEPFPIPQAAGCDNVAHANNGANPPGTARPTP